MGSARLPRLTVREGSRGVSLYSKRHNEFNRRFPKIVRAVAELKQASILDGEIVALDEEGKPRFEWLVNRGPQKGVIVYCVFDLLSLDGKDLRQVPLARPKERLERLLKNHPRLIYVEHIERKELAMFAGSLALGLEGYRSEGREKPLCRRSTPDLALAEDQESRSPRPGEGRVSHSKYSL